MRGSWPGWNALAEQARRALVVVVVAALAAAILSPLRFASPEGGSALHLPVLPSAGPALEWTADARGPGATQAEAVAGLLRLLSMFGWVGFAVGTLTIVGSYAAQAPGRAAEISIRRAVGAPLRRLMAGALLEGVVLAGIALGCGVAIGSALLSIAKATWPGYVDQLGHLGPGPAAAVCAVIGAACLIPFWLKGSSRLAREHDTQLGLRVPTVQVAVSIALLMASAALFEQADPSGSATRTDGQTIGVVAQIDLGIDTSVLLQAKYAALLARAHRPGRRVLLSLSTPGAIIGLGTTTEITTDCGNCREGGIGIRWPHFPVVAHSVSPDSFQMLGVGVLEGRGFALGDDSSAERVAVVNQVLARRYFLPGHALGGTLYLGAGGLDRPYRVIGVVEDSRRRVLGSTGQPREAVYLSILQHASRNAEVLVRSGGGSNSARDAVMESIAELGPTARLRRIAEESAASRTSAEVVEWFSSAFRLMAGAVLLMALTGVVVTMGRWADSVAWEVALRRSLGATRGRMAGSIALKVAGVACGGGILGVFLYQQIVAVSLARSVSELPQLSPAMFITALVPVALAAVFGSIPAFRILHRPPASQLR